MRDAGQPEEAIRSFASAYERLESGESALLPTAELEPAGEIDTLEQLPDADASDILDRVAVIKLNGGLATSMGLRSPEVARRGTRRSLVPGHHRRPDAGAPRALRRAPAAGADEQPGHPRGDGCARSRRIPNSASGCRSTSFRAWFPSSTPRRSSRSRWTDNPTLEWNPPGHGDVYSALRGSGMLDAMLDQGYRYAMISNADNLGSTTDARIPAHMERGDDPVPDGGGRSAPRPTARAGISLVARRTSSWSCARPRRRRPRTRSPSATTVAGATTTRTACGWTCAR